MIERIEDHNSILTLWGFVLNHCLAPFGVFEFH
ncbi:MAG: hypothetical protein JW384_02004 [Nitrosomonadaceae bacterium]|nr:hypothetical protein [Nitrosomonadaceae bacterium]